MPPARTATLHGLRSTFRDWCSETQVAPEVAEQAIGHVVTGVEGAYRCTDLFEAVGRSWRTGRRT